MTQIVISKFMKRHIIRFLNNDIYVVCHNQLTCSTKYSIDYSYHRVYNITTVIVK